MAMSIKIGLLGALIFSAFGITEVLAQADPKPNKGLFEQKNISITIRPASADPAAGFHRLLPSAAEQIPGDAVVWYGKVFAEQQGLLGYAELWRNIKQFPAMPLEEIRNNKIAQSVSGSHSLYRFLHKASRAETCNWQFFEGESSYYEVLLPQVQQCRSFARLLVIRIRLQIANQDFEGALETLTSGFGLSRNVAKGDLLVTSLVASAIADNMNEQVFEFIQQPDSPNLYWSLTDLPARFVEISGAIDMEVELLDHSFEGIANVDRDDFTKQYWDKQLKSLWDASNVQRRAGEGDLPPSSLLTHSLRVYGVAKSRLISSGLDASRVEAMPVSRVILMQAAREFRKENERHYAYSRLDCPDAIRSLNAMKQTPKPDRVLPLSTLLPIDIGSVIRAQTRPDIFVELARTVEAIRAHLAVSDGELPVSLDEITVVPVPNDPCTGNPFEYEKDGAKCTLRPALSDWSVESVSITVAKE